MPTLKIKPPHKYPQAFHLAVKLGIGKRVLLSGTHRECLLVAKKFRCFLKSLRDYPLHPLQSVLQLCDVKTRIEELPDKSSTLTIHVKRKINLDTALQ